MKFHPQKCKVLHVGKEVDDFTYTMITDGQPIELEYTKQEKDLGVTVDGTLAFEQHCELAISKANRVLGIIRRSFKYVDKDVMLTLYKSLVRPHLEYNNDIWSPKLKRTKRTLEAVQRRATRMVPELKNVPYEERLRHLGLPTLVYRRHRADMIQAFKILHQEYDLDSSKMFKSPTDDRTRGHSYKLFKERVATSLRRGFFPNRVIDLWNELPEEVVTGDIIERGYIQRETRQILVE